MKGPFFPAHEIIVACTLPPVTSEVYPGEEEEHSGTNMKGTFFLRLTGYIFKDLKSISFSNEAVKIWLSIFGLSDSIKRLYYTLF